MRLPDDRQRYKSYNDSRYHFITRLHERYRIGITNDYYDKLCAKLPNPIWWYNLDTNTKLVSIKIYNEYVLCIYRNRIKREKIPALLATALVPDGWLPCPHPLMRNGYDKYKFERDVSGIIKIIIEAGAEYARLGMRDFFINSDLPRPIKGQVKNWSQTGKIELPGIIKYISAKHSGYEEIEDPLFHKSPILKSRIHESFIIENEQAIAVYYPQINTGWGWKNVMDKGGYILKTSYHPDTKIKTDNLNTAKIFLNLEIDKIKKAENIILKYRS